MNNYEVFNREVFSMLGNYESFDTRSMWANLTNNMKTQPIYSAIHAVSQHFAKKYLDRKAEYNGIYFKCPKCKYSWDDINTSISFYQVCPECHTKTKPYKVETID